MARLDEGEYLRSTPGSAVRSRSVAQKAAASAGSRSTGVWLRPPSTYGVTWTGDAGRTSRNVMRCVCEGFMNASRPHSRPIGGYTWRSFFRLM